MSRFLKLMFVEEEEIFVNSFPEGLSPHAATSTIPKRAKYFTV
jgi:hypothetical protein